MRVDCPFCAGQTRVLDSRKTAENALRRRRECVKCKRRFTTYERIEEPQVMVVKKDGRRERFSREKLRDGLMKACEKRPVSVDDIDRAVNQIESALREKGREVTSKSIGDQVMRILKRLDKVAYIRFASVYREFTDIKSFQEELKRLK